MSDAPSDPLQLEHVLGFYPPTAVILSHDPLQGSYRLAYGTGNVVVLLDTASRRQTLLRGHRCTVSACLASPDSRLLVTADASEGGGCCVLLWDTATGQPLAMVESPHAAGTVALAWAQGSGGAPGGRPRYLVTLSAAHEATAGGRQEVALWDCAAAWAGLLGQAALQGQEDPSPTLLASAPLPPAAGRQAHLAVSSAPSPLIGSQGPLGTALGLAAQCVPGPSPVPSAPSTLATIQDGWEMATSPGTGEGAGAGLVFLSVTLVHITERLKGQGGKPSTTMQHSVWHMACSTASTTTSAAAAATSPAAAPLIPGGRRAPTVTAFLPGAHAPALNTRDELAGGIAAATDAGHVVGAGRVVLTAGSAARVVAVSGTREGSLAQWVAAPAPAPGSGEGSSLSALSLALTRKALLKLFKVTRPAYQNTARGIVSAPAEAEAVTALAPVPSGRQFLVGTADGCVRLYDLHMRLMAWWEELGGGAVLALPMAPMAGAGAAAAASAASTSPSPSALADEATQRALADTPLFIASTERALAIAVRPLDFLLPEGSPERCGELVLEGPGAAITDLAVFSPVPVSGEGAAGAGAGAAQEEPLLALALASGCLHVWSPAARALLLVRDLPVGPAETPYTASTPATSAGAAAAAAAGAASGAAAGAAPVFIPTVLAADPLGRVLAVGTSTGFLLLLDPRTLGDAQPPLPPATWDLPVAQGGRAHAPAITHAAFSPDGYHLATGDAGGHVSLYRYTRQRTRRPSSSASALTASSMLLLRKPWVGIVREADKWVEEESNVWVYLGRCKSHTSSASGSGALSGLAFSPRLDSAAASELVQWAASSGALKEGSAAAPAPAAEPLQPLSQPCPLPTPAMPGVPHKVGGSPWWGSTPSNPVVTDARHAAAGLSLLASTGAQDRRVVVYDCGGSSEGRGLLVRPSVSASSADSAAQAAQAQAAAGASASASASSSFRSLELHQRTGSAPPASIIQYMPLGATATATTAAAAAIPRPAAAAAAAATPSVRVEQSAAVSALAWLPYPEQWEDCKGSGAPPPPPSPLPPLLLANDAYKLRVWGAGGVGGVSHAATVQGPAFGGSVTRLIPIPTAASLHMHMQAAAAAAAGGGSSSSAAPFARPGASSRGASSRGSRGEAASSASTSTSTSAPAILPAASPLSYYALAYATDDRVIGLLALPIDGSPYGQSGIVAHEAAVTALAVSPAGHLFSAGGGSVSMWRVSEGACRDSGSAGPPGLPQFLGGLGEAEQRSVRDAFSYALIHSQGEGSAAPRAGGKHLPLPQLPTLLRGCGFFPSAWEEALVMGEAAALAAAAAAAAAAPAPAPAPASAGVPPPQPSVDLPNVIRLLVNHRPTRPLSPDALCSAAGAALSAVLAGSGVAAQAEGVRWGDLAALLSGLGDAIPGPELALIMGTLLESEEGAGGALLTAELGGLVRRYGAVGGALPGALLGRGGGGGRSARGGGGGGGGSGGSSDLSHMVLPQLSSAPLVEDAVVEPARLVELLKR